MSDVYSGMIGTLCRMVQMLYYIDEGKISSRHIGEFKRIIAYQFAGAYFGLDNEYQVDGIVISPKLRLAFNQAANEVCELLQDSQVDFDAVEVMLAQKFAEFEEGLRR